MKFRLLSQFKKDLSDFIYKDQFSIDTIAQACNKISSTGQPILVGTTTVEKSNAGAIIEWYKLSYQILNAKPENVRRESEIVCTSWSKR
jgi:preprotein translocase subunit SecA